MAEDLGVIEYQVRADVSDLISSSSKLDDSLSEVEKATKRVDVATTGMSTKMTKTAQAVKQATTSTNSAKGAISGLGYQMQDIAVQLQNGTNGFMVFAQQGSQIASLFGPGGAVIGAIIAIAGAIGGTLVASLSSASNAADLATRKISELTRAQKEYEQIQIGKVIKDQSVAMGQLQQRINTINYYQKINGKLTSGQAEDLAAMKNEYDTLASETNKYKERLSQLNGTSKQLGTDMLDTRQAIEVQTMAMEKGERAAALYAAKLTILSKAKEIGAGQQAINDEIATQSELINRYYDLKDAQEASRLAKQSHNKESRASSALAKKEQTAFDANSQKIRDAGFETQQLAEQYSNLTVAEDGTINSTMRHTAESAKLAAQQQLNKQATEAQVNALAKEILAQDQLKQKYEEQKKAAEERNRLTAEFNPVQQAGTDYAKQQKDLESARALNLITEQQFIQQKEILARTYEQNRLAAAEELYKQQSAGNEFLMNSLDALGNAATSTISGLLSGTMSVTEAMQNFANIILNQAVGALVEMGLNYVKQQILSQAMAAAQVATASATGTAIAAAYAPAAAMASLASFGGNAAPASAGIASTTALASGLALSGGRRYGGGVNPGSMYPVNEGGSPEMLTVGAKQYLMPNARGEVVSNSDATSGNGGITFIVNNNASNVVSTTQSYDESTKTVTLAVNEVARQLSTRTGPVSRGLQGGYNVSGRTS